MYDSRHTQGWLAVPGNVNVPGISAQTLANVCEQLSQKGLIVWKSLAGLAEGRAQITADGVDVAEGTTHPPFAITIDRSISLQNASHVQIGSGNIQNVSVDIEKLMAAIDSANATIEEKTEAKSLLQRVVANPLVKRLLESWLRGHGS